LNVDSQTKKNYGHGSSETMMAN